MSIKNLLVWTGGKSRLIPEIDKRIPENINEKYDTYVEHLLVVEVCFFIL